VKNKLLHQNTWWLGFLIFVVVSLRVIPIWGGSFAFMYDHARDSLAIWEMAALQKPALLGAQTSIPGLYYGPAWYYLALPLNVLFSFHPLASVLTTVLLAVIAIVFATRSFDKITTLLLATSVGLVAAQQSGWSPYLTSITSIFILTLSQRLQTTTGRRNFWFAGALMFTLSLSFHFQPAFAIVQLPLVFFALRSLLNRFSWREKCILFVVFLTPFLPQVLFEIRHNFHQTTQLWYFVSHYGEEAARVGQNTVGLERVVEVGRYVLASATSVLPQRIAGFGFVLLVLAAWDWKQHKKTDLVTTLARVLLVGTFLSYLVIPAKAYYFVGLTPYLIYLFANSIRQLRLPARGVFVIISILTIVQLGASLQIKEAFLATRNTYAAKQAAVATVVELAQGEPFVVYHYVPELYDYTYQILHFREMKNNANYLPVELAYEPSKTLYLDEYSTKEWAPSVSSEEQQRIFLVVEADDRVELYQAWLDRVGSGYTVQEAYTINPEITIFELEPNADGSE